MSKVVFTLFILLTVLVLFIATIALFSESRPIIVQKGWMVYLGFKTELPEPVKPRNFDFVDVPLTETERLFLEQSTASASLQSPSPSPTTTTR